MILDRMLGGLYTTIFDNIVEALSTDTDDLLVRRVWFDLVGYEIGSFGDRFFRYKRIWEFFRMIRITMRMRMIRIEREMRMIVRVDRALTVKDSWVWMNPSWLEAWIVIDVDGNVDEGIPEMIPVDWLRERPGGRVPEVIVNRGLSPEMIGEIENDCPLMRVNENWE